MLFKKRCRTGIPSVSPSLPRNAVNIVNITNTLLANDMQYGAGLKIRQSDYRLWAKCGNCHKRMSENQMNDESLLARFSQLRIWSARDQRAPHKPLLVIWAIGRCLKGEPRLVPFSLVDSELTRLLRRFGPHRRTIHTDYPFWRLQNDDVWEIDSPHSVRLTNSGNAYKTDLLDNNIHGGLIESDYDRLRDNPSLALVIVNALLAAHFPYSLHDDILRAVGFDEQGDSPRISDFEGSYATRRYRQRDNAFRKMMLTAYGNQCAVCEFSVRLNGSPVAIEAAHIHWHAAAGPSEARNGIVLCSLHHSLFDYGAFTLLPDLKVFVSDAAKGQGVQEALGKYHGAYLHIFPKDTQLRPASKFLEWHTREVFRTPSEIPH